MPNKRKVYLMGAGASKLSDFGLPTMSEFFDEKELSKENYRNLSLFIERKFRNTSLAKVNLEELVTRLELSLDSFGAFGEYPQSYLIDARRELDQYVRWRLEYTPIEGRDWCRKHKELFDRLGPDDTLITLNYDQIIEHTLAQIPLGKGYSGMLHCHYELLGPTPPQYLDQPTVLAEEVGSGIFLKLHGSINWVYCSNRLCSNHSRFYANRVCDPKHTLEELQRGYSLPGHLCRMCGNPLVSVIVPPTMLKAFDQFPKMGLIWSLAFLKLKEADSIVIIGASLPSSDYYLRWLVIHSMTSRDDGAETKILVVDTDSEVSDRVERLTGRKPGYFACLDEYIRAARGAI